jgi:hypothetical protein
VRKVPCAYHDLHLNRPRPQSRRLRTRLWRHVSHDSWFAGRTGWPEPPGGLVGILGVIDLPRIAAIAPECADFGSAARTSARLRNQHRCSRISGNTSYTAFQKPSAPSPMASTGAVIPRRRQSRSRSTHDSVDSRYPSVSATSSLRPSARTPIITSKQSFCWSRLTLRWIPSTQR